MAAVWDSSPLEKCLFEKNSQAENCCFVWPPGVQTLRVSLQKTHFRGQRNLSVANFSLYVRRWAAHLKVDSILFFCEKGRWKKKQTLSWGFAFIRVSLNLEKVRDRDRDSFYPSLYPSFISSSWPSIPSIPGSGPGGHSLFSVLRGPVFSGCWQHVADRLCSLF